MFPYTIVSYLARAATPVSLIVLGGQFDFKRMAGYRKQLVLGVGGRNFMAPLIGVGGAVILTLSGHADFGPDVFAAIIALFGTPVAVASAIMSEVMDQRQSACRTIGCMDINPFAHNFVHNYFYCLGLGIALVIFNKIKYNSRSKNGTCKHKRRIQL